MKTIVLNVRSAKEFNFDGHAVGSVNYPLD